MIKFSKQREAIRIYLDKNIVHPTADEVYEHVRREFPNISLATVYRNLNQLAEMGDIQKLGFAGFPDHYDFETKQHAHFLCRKCGKVYDLGADFDEFITDAVKTKAPGRIESCTLDFNGVCTSCDEMA